jgi:hypothetical protein
MQKMEVSMSITSKDTIYIGSRPGLTGILPRGAIIIGGAGGDPLRPIDMTSPTLDSRVNYQCASQHAYFADDGTIKFAEPNIWPLEYKNGVAIGRHEPEPERTNIVKYNARFADVTAIGNPGRWGINRTDGVQSQTDTAPDGSQSLVVKLTVGGVAAGQGVYATSYDSATTGMRTISGWYKSSNIVMRCFTEPLASDAYQILQPTNTWQRWRVTRDVDGISSYAGTIVFYSFNSIPDDNSKITGWGWQLENGSIATSPIMTNANSITRSAASATIITTNSSAITVHYSDSTTSVYDTPSDTFTLPVSNSDWGTRYIQRIEYRS